ncbi:MAG: phosphoribosyltransferase [Dehalococcoidia bacterium]|jgi:orotate phosphoribosyltransferase/uridine monophosphate synthetase|nr:phosphoribosyltransferase [Dehalococcoidia bacterium]MDW8008968.1 phosphoribosyltransferase [Chloroflexota bacterium]
MPQRRDPENLWLARVLWDLGAIQFGDFTLGRTTLHSPVYVNLRLLTSNPRALWRTARVMWDTVRTLQGMARPHILPFQRVTGIPFGGLHLALAFSLVSKVPLVYIHPPKGKDSSEPFLEGVYRRGERVLLIDDLVTSGTNVIETAAWLHINAGLQVRDVLVLVDRDEGARQRLKGYGLNLISILTLEQILNYLMVCGKIDEEWYRRSIEYIQSRRAAATGLEAEG